MKKTLISTSIVALIHAMAALPALASDVKLNSYMTNGDLLAFCDTAGVGSEKKAQVTLADGTIVFGEVDCEAEAIAKAKAGDATAMFTDSRHDGLDDEMDDESDDDEEDDDEDHSGHGGDDDSEDDDDSDDSDDSDDDSDEEDDSGDDEGDDKGGDK